MIEQLIKDGLAQAQADEFKANTRNCIIGTVSECVEFMVDRWLEPKEASEMLAGLITMRAVRYNVPLQYTTALVSQAYEVNLGLHEDRKAREKGKRRPVERERER